MPLPITIQSLTKTYKSRHAPHGGLVHAVHNASLTIAPGELFFLLGPSGCGKTTLLRMIAGFIEPDPTPKDKPGSIHFADRDVTHTPPNKRNTAMVFQSYALWPHMTVAQNVAFGLNVRKTPAEDRDRRVTEALEAVQLAEYAARKPNELSGGQQQRVALARALVIRPDVLLLDEPLSNLDAKLRADLRAQVRTICKSAGITSVYVTHDQQEALSMADRIAIMRLGRIEQIATPKDLYTRPRTAFVATFLGDANILPAQLLSNPHLADHTPTDSTTTTQTATAVTPTAATPTASTANTPPSQSPLSTERPINIGSGAQQAATRPAQAETDRQVVVTTPIGTLAATQPISANPDRSPSIDADHQLLIRPESIRFVGSATPGTIPATIADRTYLGSTVTCQLDIAGTTLYATCPAADAPTTDQAHIALDPTDLILLAPEPTNEPAKPQPALT